MATRFYTDPTNTPDVSPSFHTSWEDTTQAVRRKLVIDTKGDNASTDFTIDEVAASYDRVCAVQFVSEPLDAISATLPVLKGVFRCLESNAKANCLLCFAINKCDSNGSNVVEFKIEPDNTEFDAGALTARFSGPFNETDQVFNQGDRLILEVGSLFMYEKVSSYNATISVTDNHATDLGENNTDTAAYNSWFETGDTFTVASGEPATMKLGPMFAFA